MICSVVIMTMVVEHLGDGGLPDALGEAGGGGVPHVHVDGAGVEGAPGHGHLGGKVRSVFRELLVM